VAKSSSTRKTTAKKKTKTAPKTAASRKKTPAKSAAKKKTQARKSPAEKRAAVGKRTATRAAGAKPAAAKAAAKQPVTLKSTTKKPAVKTNTPKPATTRKAAAGATVRSAARKTKKVTGAGRTGRSVAEVAAAASADDKGYVFINGRRIRMISTKGITRKKRPDTEGSAADNEIKVASPEPMKTKLSRKELNHYRNLLLIKRAELVGDLSGMEAEALRSGGGNLSHMPIHMADIGTDTFDQDFMLGLAETERQRLREIDEALGRIEDSTYGVCHMTNKPIPKARLNAKPWAKYTVEAARELERGWAT